MIVDAPRLAAGHDINRGDIDLLCSGNTQLVQTDRAVAPRPRTVRSRDKNISG